MAELVPFNRPFLTHHPIKGPSNPTQTNCVPYENYFMLFIYGLDLFNYVLIYIS